MGGTIGDLDFDSGDLATTKTINVTIANAVSVGAVSVESTAGSANLDLNGDAALSEIGNIRVDGDVDLTGLQNNALTKVGNVSIDGVLTLNGVTLGGLTIVGDFAVGSFSKTAGSSTIGAGIGATVGYITVIDPDAGGTPITFSFDIWDAAGANNIATVNTGLNTVNVAYDDFATAVVVDTIDFADDANLDDIVFINA